MFYSCDDIWIPHRHNGGAQAMDAGAGIAFAADGATVAAGSFNTVWLVLHRAAARLRERRTAAVALALLNAGAAMQAIFAQALYAAHRFAQPEGVFFSAPAWVGSRLVLLAGVVAISALILRRSGR
jgi:hypothetical protein